ncbi:MAG: hypothetical protein DRP66_07450 [Planctomycetota bacterium]|nr:MAG: hypothetical protein DRP66_07450 [Planctomycetota bacterium]
MREEDAEMKINRKTTALTIVGLLLVFAGCQDPLTTDTAAPWAAAGGNKTEIVAHCIVTFYLGEGADYFSEQKQILRPALGDIYITAREPEGTFRRQLAGGAYKSSGPAATVDQSPAGVIDRDIVLAIITAFRASAGYYTAESGEKLDQVRIDGKWRLPIKLPGGAVKGATITLLQSPDDGEVDFVWVHNTANDALTTARAYNIRWLEDAKIFVPTKIDIFRRAAGAITDKKMLQIHYRSFSAP